MERKVFKLSDEFIGQVAKVLQLAMLSGTNIVDHMRLMRVEPTKENEQVLSLTPEYTAYFEGTIQKMLDDVEKLQDEASEDPVGITIEVKQN